MSRSGPPSSTRSRAPVWKADATLAGPPGEARPRSKRSTDAMTSGLKVGMHLHPERGVDAVLAEARAADEQGYDSVWLADHLMREPEDPGRAGAETALDPPGA
jgi:hypothetical protein